MSRYGVIIKTMGDKALVSSSRRGVCDNCADKDNCSFDRALGQDVPDEVTVMNPINARTGDSVEFDLPGHAEMRVSLLVWGLPVAGLLAGALLGGHLAETSLAGSMDADLAGIAGAAIGFFGSFLPLVAYDRWARNDRTLVPVVLRVVPPGTCAVPEAPKGPSKSSAPDQGE